MSDFDDDDPDYRDYYDDYPDDDDYEEDPEDAYSDFGDYCQDHPEDPNCFDFYDEDPDPDLAHPRTIKLTWAVKLIGVSRAIKIRNFFDRLLGTNRLRKPRRERF